MRRVRQTRPDAAAVLTVNAGSSSLRLARFAAAGAEPAARAHAAPPPAASAAYLQRFVPADGGRVEVEGEEAEVSEASNFSTGLLIRIVVPPVSLSLT